MAAPAPFEPNCKLLIGLAVLCLVGAARPPLVTAQRAATARARVTVTVVQGAVALTDSVVQHTVSRFLEDRRTLPAPSAPGAPPALPLAPRTPVRAPEGLVAVRIHADSTGRAVRMSVEYVGTD